MIAAGQLKDRITVEVKSETEDGYGGKVGVWGQHCEVWARVERQKSFSAAAERIRSGAQDSQPVARVHFRKSAETSAITTDMRVVFQDTYFNVVTPPQDIEGDNRILTIMVTHGAPT